MGAAPDRKVMTDSLSVSFRAFRGSKTGMITLKPGHDHNRFIDARLGRAVLSRRIFMQLKRPFCRSYL